MSFNEIKKMVFDYVMSDIEFWYTWVMTVGSEANGFVETLKECYEIVSNEHKFIDVNDFISEIFEEFETHCDAIVYGREETRLMNQMRLMGC